MATYNGEKYLHSQISTIISQLQSNEKLFISDDGSSDDTVKIAKSFGAQVQVVGTSRVGGVVPNFERVLTAAYNAGACNIILSDQDDTWAPGRMNSIREGLKDVDVLLMNGYVTDYALNPTGLTIFDQVRVRRGLVANLIRPTYVGCCMAFNRQLLSIALPFPKSLPWHDWFISLIGELYFRVKFDPKPSIYYRRHESNHSNTGQKSNYSLLRKIRMRIYIFRAIAIAIYRYKHGLK